MRAPQGPSIIAIGPDEDLTNHAQDRILDTVSKRLVARRCIRVALEVQDEHACVPRERAPEGGMLLEGLVVPCTELGKVIINVDDKFGMHRVRAAEGVR